MAKLVRCKTCGAEIAKSAKTCPHCGARQHTAALSLCAVIIVLTIFACVGILSGPEDDSTKDTDSPSSVQIKENQIANKDPEDEMPIELSAHDLWVAYDENEVNADNLYKKKAVCVTGTVFEIGKDLLTDTPFIALKAEDDLGIYSVQCFFQDSSEHGKVASVKDGDKVTITGKCTGKSINVMLRDCTIIE